jgi:hypothetical protein
MIDAGALLAHEYAVPWYAEKYSVYVVELVVAGLSK